MIQLVIIIVVITVLIFMIFFFLILLFFVGNGIYSLKTKLIKRGKGYTLKQINKHLNTTKRLDNPRLYSFSCVEDHTSPYHTLGGDMGEFILGLQVYTDTCQALNMDPRETEDLFLEYIDSQSDFYMHTNTQAMKAVEDILDIQIPEDFSSFPEDRQDEFLKLLETHPEVYGCGHLQNMFINPQSYGTTSHAVYTSCQAFFKHVWTNKKAKLCIIDEEHKEKAFVSIECEHKRDDVLGTLVPEVSSVVGKSCMYTYI